MNDFSTPLPSGMRVRDIKTKVVAGKVVADLDANGQEQELTVVHVPLTIEAVEGAASVRKATIDGFIADMKGGKSADVALVRASAVMQGADPVAAETAFSAAQQAGNVGAEVALGDTLAQPPVQPPVQPGGLS